LFYRKWALVKDHGSNYIGQVILLGLYVFFPNLLVLIFGDLDKLEIGVARRQQLINIFKTTPTQKRSVSTFENILAPIKLSPSFSDAISILNEMPIVSLLLLLFFSITRRATSVNPINFMLTTYMETKIYRNNTKKQKYENNLYMFLKTVS
jgi:hypothetical protein